MSKYGRAEIWQNMTKHGGAIFCHIPYMRLRRNILKFMKFLGQIYGNSKVNVHIQKTRNSEQTLHMGQIQYFFDVVGGHSQVIRSVAPLYITNKDFLSLLGEDGKEK